MCVCVCVCVSVCLSVCVCVCVCEYAGWHARASQASCLLLQSNPKQTTKLNPRLNPKLNRLACTRISGRISASSDTDTREGRGTASTEALKIAARELALRDRLRSCACGKPMYNYVLIYIYIHVKYN